jgi:excisionase family DNA binding protein
MSNGSKVEAGRKRDGYFVPPGQPKPIAVTISEACRISGLGRTTVYELIRSGKLKAILVRRRRLVIHASIEALFIDQNDD